MVRITGNFQQERVLHPAATSLLSELFSKGWPDPTKLNNQSRQTALLLQQAKESFAKQLNVRTDEIEFLGETDLGFQIGIQGLLTKESKFYYSAIDRQKVFAIAAVEEKAGRDLTILPVNDQGVIQEGSVSESDLLIWQVANGETGNIQKAPTSKCQIFADCTSSGIDHLPDFEYQSALFDSTSWAGPSGVGVLVIKSNSKWRNPLPHNDLTRVPNSYSLALVLASAVAIENYAVQIDIRLKLKKFILDFIAEQMDDVDIASNIGGLSKNISISVKGIEADRLLLALEDSGYAVDSGSACKSADMQPSHVLAAMNRPITGNIRLTLHKEMTEETVKDFCQALKSNVLKLRKS